MFNIIRSLNYTARRSIVNWITIISLIIMPLFVMYIEIILGGGEYSITPSAYFASQQMAGTYIFTLFGLMILSCNLSAGDAGDKTINYEYMAGHSRTSIFFARTIAGLLWGGLLVLILMMLPLAYLGIFNGWGPETDKENVILRSLLVIFPIIRFSSFCIMVSMISRSAGKGIALGYGSLLLVAMVTSIADEVFHKTVFYGTSYTNGYMLLISENCRAIVENGKKINIYDTGVSVEMIWKTILVSIAFTIIYLLIAFIYNKKTDRD
ncbi:MAG: hypothetical protein K6E10_04740 [Eubacterium sp.]|nr:hypothetical protein [Eubacterium sp.]